MVCLEHNKNSIWKEGVTRFMKKSKWTYIWFGMLCLLIILGVYSAMTKTGGPKTKGTIVFADAGWDSIRVHNYIAGFIAEHGYGYQMDTINGSTAATLTGLRQGQIDVYMEVWKNNVKKTYEAALKAGDIKQLGTNFTTNEQGFFVPTYMIKGDPQKGIKPMAPDLKSVEDLNKYWKLFKDPSTQNKGMIVGGYSGSEAQKIMQKKVKTYGLDQHFEYFTPGSEAALTSSIVKAFKNHDPWVGYYWTPTWLTTKYDMTMLKEPAYNAKTWNKNYGTKFPTDHVYIAVNKDLKQKAPDVVTFLKHYHTTKEETGQALLYMQEHKASPKQAAQWWLKKYENVWTKWVPKNVANKVKAAL